MTRHDFDTSRTRHIKPFYVMDVLERAKAMEREGTSVIHLEVGEPDFDTPEPVKRAICEALDRNETHYTHSLGIPELREAISAHYQEKYGVRVSPEQVAVTNGTSPAMLLLFTAILEPGQEVILSDPHYACYPTFVRMACGEPVFVPVHEDDGFQYRADSIRAALTDQTRAIFINSPSNPTGNLLSSERMEKIAALAQGDGPAIASDEIYHGLVCEGEECTILEFADN
ncbi:MAG: aminotransferase class I/II-fold pyridoxal phosphate-dependent enzyme, partial [Desulfovibrio sp.]